MYLLLFGTKNGVGKVRKTVECERKRVQSDRKTEREEWRENHRNSLRILFTAWKCDMRTQKEMQEASVLHWESLDGARLQWIPELMRERERDSGDPTGCFWKWKRRIRKTLCIMCELMRAGVRWIWWGWRRWRWRWCRRRRRSSRWVVMVEEVVRFPNWNDWIGGTREWRLIGEERLKDFRITVDRSGWCVHVTLRWLVSDTDRRTVTCMTRQETFEKHMIDKRIGER